MCVGGDTVNICDQLRRQLFNKRIRGGSWGQLGDMTLGVGPGCGWKWAPPPQEEGPAVGKAQRSEGWDAHLTGVARGSRHPQLTQGAPWWVALLILGSASEQRGIGG